ncbi:hypothetical protein L2755_09470 [Shewanella abyssi]|uniref:PD-(D/E)XK nuclease superfamily protein n=1 Tax=Shewanella abyssi TaxID=311789 RepID=UPI00200E4AC1|nr:PD-(D/E)XK nuclease superfamily protein [Shewanella abyssi]MCL1049849.1 hypothetical protein [Shewanella abyssi]
MSRQQLLDDVACVIEGNGFEESSDGLPFTYQRNVRYPSIIDGKRDTAHFLLHTRDGSIQLVVKYQEVNGTAIEKLGYTALDANRTPHQQYLVVCGGDKLLSQGIDFLNDRKSIAPKLHALDVHELDELIPNLVH